MLLSTLDASLRYSHSSSLFFRIYQWHIQGEAVRLKRLRQAGYFENVFRFQRFNPQDAAEKHKTEKQKEPFSNHSLLKNFQSHATGLTWIRNDIILVWQRNEVQNDVSFAPLNKTHKRNKETKVHDPHSSVCSQPIQLVHSQTRAIPIKGTITVAMATIKHHSRSLFTQSKNGIFYRIRVARARGYQRECLSH